MKTILIILTGLSIMALAFLLVGFIWMISLGVLSHVFQAPKLALSYWSSVLVSVIVGLLTGGFRASK